MSENIFYVYLLSRPWNGEPCYVGKGKGKRRMKHAAMGEAHDNKHLANIFAKAARHGLQVDCIVLRDGLCEQEAFQTEIDLIAALGRRDLKTGPLVNKTDGGEGASNPSAADRAKKSAIRKIISPLIWSDPSFRIKHAAAVKAAWADPEYKVKHSAALIAHWADPKHKAERSAINKAIWSDPQRRLKKSAVAKLQWADPKFKAKIVASQKAYWARRRAEKEGVLSQT